MKTKYISAILCFLLPLTFGVELQTVNGKIKISIVTTSACIHTINFISQPLAEVYEEYKDYLEVEFIPWGRTRRDEDQGLICQFGPNDCWANRVHRCALDLLKHDQDAQVDYMVCEFTNPLPAWSGNYICAQKADINLVDIDYCVTTSGDALDYAAEAANQEPMAVINMIPAVFFNDQPDIPLRNEAVRNLRSLICFALAEDPTTNVTHCQI